MSVAAGLEPIFALRMGIGCATFTESRNPNPA